jgi:RNA polymerase sigma-70 factor, ECF subfamily
MPDLEQFTRLWTEAQPIVAGYLRALVRDRAIAEDLLQETAVDLMRRFAEYDPGRPFNAWALGCAKMHVLSWRRDESRNLITFDEDLLNEFTLHYVKAGIRIHKHAADLDECLEGLSGRSREAIHLHYYEDLSMGEISKKLQMTDVAVRVMFSRLRSWLRECIERRNLSENI